MLCYRCGSYTPDDSRKCIVCGQPIAERRRSSRNLSGSTSGKVRAIPPFDSGEVIGSRYRIRDSAAPGTTGWVMRARDEEVDIDVAIKVVASNLLQAEDERTAFFKAVKMIRKLQHANLVRIYDEGRDERFLYYTMQFLEGLNLRKIIDLRAEKKQAFTFAEALPLFGQLAQALDAMESVSCHGALRPGNVMVLPDVLKLTGLPHFHGLPRKPFVALQQKSSALEYLAPEARRDDVLVDRRADVYSMAVIFGEMVTGLVYGRDAAAWEQAEKQLPRKLVAALRRGLAEAPSSRFETASSLFEALAEAALEGQPAGEPAWLGPQAQTTSLEEFSDEFTPQPGPLTMDIGGRSTSKLPELAVEIPSRPSVRRPERLGRPARSYFMVGVAAVILVTGIAVSASIWQRHRAAVNDLQPVVEPVATAPLPAATPAVAPRVAPAPVPSAAPARPAPVDKHKDPPRRLSTPEPEHRPSEPQPPPPPPPPDRRPVSPGLETPPPVVSQAGRGCPPGMVMVEGGTFEMGSRASDPMRGFDEVAAQRRRVDAFCVDVYEYPNERGKSPAANLTWARAKHACEKAGKRLCNEVEWERACKGPSEARFPFGDEFSASACNVSEDSGGLRKPGDAGAFSRCKSGFGVVDMSGNLAEWTASQWSKDVADKVVKGGAADQAAFMARCAARANESAASHRGNLGFRCCADPK